MFCILVFTVLLLLVFLFKCRTIKYYIFNKHKSVISFKNVKKNESNSVNDNNNIARKGNRNESNLINFIRKLSENASNQVYFWSILLMTIFHAISTFSNSFIIEVIIFSLLLFFLL